MVEAVTGVTESGSAGSSSSSNNAYDWFYNPEYQKGINQGIQTQSGVDKQSQEQTQQQIAELYESLGQTPPNQSGGSSF